MRNLRGSHEPESLSTLERNKRSALEKDGTAHVAGRIENKEYFVNFIYKDLMVVRFIID
jgi:hypothetical protein